MPQSPFPPAADPSHSSGASNFKRWSLPPSNLPAVLPGHLLPQQGAMQHSYNASPLSKPLTPPPADDPAGPNDPEPFPSVESSIESTGSGQQFHISASGLPASASTNTNSSPLHHYAHPYQHSQSSSFGSKADNLEIICANCGRPWLLKNSFACTSCICGVCNECVGQIISSPIRPGPPGQAPTRQGCPKCYVMGGQWKKFNVDWR
jgi:hypothetical protein